MASAAVAAAAAAGEDPTANRVLDEAREIRRQAIQWDAYAQSVSSEELARVSAFVKKEEERERVLKENSTEPLVALFVLFDKLAGKDVVKYIVTLLADLLEDNAAFADIMIKASDSLEHPVLDLLSKKLGRSEDVYICHQSARIFARLLLAGAEPEAPALAAFFKWLLGELAQDERARVLLALTTLAVAVRRPNYRLAFCQTPGALEAVKVLVRPDAHVQQQYQAVLSLWIISFSSKAIAAMGEVSLALVSATADVLSAAKKEKVVRVCLAFLRNVLEHCEDSNVKLEMAVLMVSHRLLSTVNNIASQATYNDEELKDDAEVLAEKLRDTFEHMSTFDEYVAEVRSGKLEWSPVHRSERFWRENAVKLNDRNHELLKLLVTYLQKAEDVTSVAVAIHDCGEYVSHYPYGRKALGDLEAKAAIMELMNHEDSTVRYEALLAVQKMMTDNWEYLGKKAKQAAEQRSY